MSQATEFPIIYKLSMQDRGVKSGLEGIHATLKKGGVATELSSKKMVGLESAISSQNRAIGLANSLWTTSHANLMSMGAALGSVGSMGTQLVSIFTMLNTQQSLIGDKQRGLTEAAEDLSRAQRIADDLLKQTGDETAPAYVEAMEDVYEIEDRIVGLNNDLAESQKNVEMQNIAAGMSMMGVVSQGITLISILGMMKARGVLTTAALGAAGLTGAIVGMGAGLVIATAAVAFSRQEGESWADTTSRMIGEAAGLPPGIREITQVFIAAGGGVLILGQALFDGLAAVGKFIVDSGIAFGQWVIDSIGHFENWAADGLKWMLEFGSNAISGIETWIADSLTVAVDGLTSLSSTVWQWGSNVVKSFADGLWAGIHWVTDAVAGIASAAKNFIGIESPAKEGPLSHLMEWGPNLVHTYATGIESAQGEVINASRNMAGNISSSNDWGGNSPSVGRGDWKTTSGAVTNHFHITLKGGNAREQARELYEEFRRVSE